MTKQLRKQHLQVWLLLLPLLPLAFISARLVIPEPTTDNLLQPTQINALPILSQSYRNDNFTISIRKGADSSQQLEWINNQALTVPTAVIYKTAKGIQSIKNAEMIGRIEARGIYRFPMKHGAVEQLLLYDFIHQQIIGTIKF